MRIALVFLVFSVCLIDLIWVLSDRLPLPEGDSYGYLIKTLRFAGEPFGESSWASLGALSLAGRPPLYQLLTNPFVSMSGRPEQTALLANIPFLALLMVATYHTARLARNAKAGILAALLVACYPPIINLSRSYDPVFAAVAWVALTNWILLLLLQKRDVVTAWVLGGVLGIGLLLHPMFLLAVAFPSLAAGVLLVLGERTDRPSHWGSVPRWLWEGFRDPVIFRGLLGAVSLALLLALPWYLSWGLPLFGTAAELNSRDLAEFRGYPVFADGFEGIERSVAWYLWSAPAVLSNVLVGLLGVGMVMCAWKRTVAGGLLLLMLVSTYALLGLQTTHSWRYMALALPSAAAVTAVGLRSCKPNWFSNSLSAVAVVAAIVCFSITNWGAHSDWARNAAMALGSPLDSETCGRRENYAFCPLPAEDLGPIWQVPEFLDAIREDSACGADRHCLLVVVRDERRHPRFSMINLFRSHLIEEWPDSNLHTAHEGRSAWGGAFRLRNLLLSDYLLYVDEPAEADAGRYRRATLQFLRSPPPGFSESHAELFSYPAGKQGTARLLKRTRPLTVQEAEEAIRHIDLPEMYLAERVGVLAELYAKEGEFDVALELVEESEDTALQVKVLGLMAMERARVGRTDEAIALYQQLIELEPTNVVALIRMGQFHTREKRFSEGVHLLQEAIRLGDRTSWAKSSLAGTYLQMGEENLALVLFREALDLDPKNISARINVGRWYEDQGDVRAAVEEYEVAVANAPENPWPLRNLARGMEGLGHEREAEILYRKVLALDPDDRESERALSKLTE